VPEIFFGIALALKYMPQVTIAMGAENFYATPVGIPFAANRTVDFIVKAGPTAVRCKLALRPI
jgi:hypothetical protein